MYQVAIVLFAISLCGVVYIAYHAWQLKKEGDKLEKRSQRY